MAVSYNDFSKIEMRVGRIVKVEEIEGSQKLYKLTVDFGNEKKIAVSGIKQYYKPEDLLEKKFIFVTNLERRKIMGVESECMILAVEDGDKVVLIQPEKNVKEGSKIR
ncbi:MAG: methionine--tRNA ligase subunit beta [Candidatus Aenigmarchaeota archaeon]|nr:methionine--tRNA ligase subunit beta [Candidatus Aenigmarchaeota archaeon]MCX8190684.1 methionine--tRNA ligase subunit beta [Candidatus Aenigmarchaeota archaeon]MDW8159933.1 methionine--tRNA ligase subunit beta [Candidatus Aenigmarchaeota archaeon]